MAVLTNANKPQKSKSLRHAEYYDMTDTFDELYQRSKTGSVFTHLIPIIASKENIKLAYRNIKRNHGSNTSGVDRTTITDIEKMAEDEFIRAVQAKIVWYKPKPVRRVEIPKPDGKIRPLGIPTMWDRVVQQCILQVLDPICEAKFYEYSNGFRPNRSAENAIAQCCKRIQQQNLHYVVDIDIKGFFDNVNHSKLIRQMWALGIRDKNLICIVKKMLKAPVQVMDGEVHYPDKGTPQGGILSPLLSNIVLNELDWWIASQWEEIPTEYPYKCTQDERPNRGDKYSALRKTKLKEMYIIRYADDFKIFCRKHSDAIKIFEATKRWLQDRLKLDISEEKSKVINLKEDYFEFLGFKLKAVRNGNKYKVRSYMSDKAVENETRKLKEQIKLIQHPANLKEEGLATMKYNSMVIGIHNYYRIATCISLDCKKMAFGINATLINRLGMNNRLMKEGVAWGYIRDRYGNSKQLRFIHEVPLCPIGYVKTKNAMHKGRKVNKYTKEGRKVIHNELGVNMNILHQLMRATETNRSIEYMDNRISLYAAQHGKCAITRKILELEDIHCHHKTPINLGGKDEYSNLLIIDKNVHMLIHASVQETIDHYLGIVKPDQYMRMRINTLRKLVGNEPRL